MNYYEHTLIARQDLVESQSKELTDKYEKIIEANSGKVLKIEKWGLLNFKRKIKSYTKGHFLHFKLQAQKETLDEIKSKTKLDNNIVRFLTVKYKSLDLKTEYFSKNKN